MQEGGERPSVLNDPEHYIQGLEIRLMDDKSILLFYHGQFGPAPLLQPFWAIGSGMHLAIGAMAAGYTAYGAVMIASRYDTCTNHKVTALELVQ